MAGKFPKGVKTGLDLDSVTDFCWFRIKGAISSSGNVPYSDWNFFINIPIDSIYSLQFSVPASGKELKFRLKWDKVFADWVTL